jgi:ribosomal protein L12E/L44/L45/RPP1/RPP2
MKAITRLLLPLIAYLCVGTVISAALGYGYLRQTGKLDDEKMFRIMATLHGLDLEEIAKEGQATVEETPPEEASFAAQQGQLQAATLRFDAKQKQLSDSLVQFQYQVDRVTAARERYDELRTAVEAFLTQQQNELTNSDLGAVLAQVQALIPKKQAKPLLIKYIQDGEIDLVVKILGSMKERNRREILRTFDVVPDDIDMLFQIQQHMLNDNPAKAKITEQLEALQQLKAEDK